jgi:hypothetical protein
MKFKIEKKKDLSRKIITVQHHKITHLRGNTTSHISQEFMCCMGMEYVVDMEKINTNSIEPKLYMNNHGYSLENC